MNKLQKTVCEEQLVELIIKEKSNKKEVSKDYYIEFMEYFEKKERNIGKNTANSSLSNSPTGEKTLSVNTEVNLTEEELNFKLKLNRSKLNSSKIFNKFLQVSNASKAEIIRLHVVELISKYNQASANTLLFIKTQISKQQFAFWERLRLKRISLVKRNNTPLQLSVYFLIISA